MLHFAVKMLIGDKAKYIGIVLGIMFASFIITQQAAIFIGLMTRTYGFIADTSQPDIWVMDPKVQFVDDIKPLRDMRLYRVRGIEGVRWAVPLYKGLINARLSNGMYQSCVLIGIDDASLIGGPPEMIEGRLVDLRLTNGIIIDDVGAKDKLAVHAADGTVNTVNLYDTIELNDRRAVVVGISKVARTFQSQPVVYTTYLRALSFAPPERKQLSFILVKADKGVSPSDLCQRIRDVTGLAAYTQQEFQKVTVDYFMKRTGIPINFGTAVFLGLIIGCAIAGQTFYNFTLDNLRHFGTFKAMGASNATLVKMILFQALIVGAIGWGLGMGLSSIFGFLCANSELSFIIPWQLFVGSGIVMLLICLFAALISVRTVLRLEPAIVFKS